MRKLNFPGPRAQGKTRDLRHRHHGNHQRRSICIFCCCTSHGNYEGASSEHLNLNPRRLPTSGKQSEWRPSPLGWKWADYV